MPIWSMPARGKEDGPGKCGSAPCSPGNTLVPNQGDTCWNQAMGRPGGPKAHPLTTPNYVLAPSGLSFTGSLLLMLLAVATHRRSHLHPGPMSAPFSVPLMQSPACCLPRYVSKPHGHSLAPCPEQANSSHSPELSSPA